MKTVLHLTAHLGGGVGKALSGLACQAAAAGSPFSHQFVILETQEKPQFLKRIVEAGCEVVVCPDKAQLRSLIEAADIVQLEWWNHPATLRALCSEELPPMRLIVWSHVSGVYTPIIPAGLVKTAHRFLFTSPCSFDAEEIRGLSELVRERTGVVSSSGGFDGLPCPTGIVPKELSVGYFGSLNFSKLHPRYVEFLAAVTSTHFRVKIIGDLANSEILMSQCLKAGRPGVLDFLGYQSDVASALSSLNVLAYLLNPQHYGTTENALLEAMAMGVVPVVLNNPAERSIIENGENGLLVRSPREFADAICWLEQYPDEYRRLAFQASSSVRSKFAVEKMESQLSAHYQSVLTVNKEKIPFRDVFGIEPAEWFLACQRNRTIFTDSDSAKIVPDEFEIHGLIEKKKGTVFHFREYFPGDPWLSAWAQKLAVYQVEEGLLA